VTDDYAQRKINNQQLPAYAKVHSASQPSHTSWNYPDAAFSKPLCTRGSTPSLTDRSPPSLTSLVTRLDHTTLTDRLGQKAGGLTVPGCPMCIRARNCPRSPGRRDHRPSVDYRVQAGSARRETDNSNSGGRCPVATAYHPATFTDGAYSKQNTLKMLAEVRPPDTSGCFLAADNALTAVPATVLVRT